MSLKKIFILALLIAPLVYAYQKKPLIDAHKAKIYQVATKTEEPPKDDVMTQTEWDELEFVDWVFLTATKDKLKQSLVSYGIVNYIKVLDGEWAPRVFGLVKDEKKE